LSPLTPTELGNFALAVMRHVSVPLYALLRLNVRLNPTHQPSPAPELWSSPLWQHGLVPILQVLGPVLTALIAVTGALWTSRIQARAGVAAQEKAQQLISDRELAKQARLNEAVRAQIESYLTNITFGSEFLIRYPSAFAVSILPAEIRAFATRVADLDVATAFSPNELRALLNTGTLLRNVPEAVETGGYGRDEDQLTEQQASAALRWHSFVTGWEAAIAAAVLGSPNVLRRFRMHNSDTRALELYNAVLSAYPNLTKEHLVFQYYEADDEARVQSYQTFTRQHVDDCDKA
jgi:hypothetical protein